MLSSEFYEFNQSLRELLSQQFKFQCKQLFTINNKLSNNCNHYCSKRYRDVAGGRVLSLNFNTSHQIILKKTRFGSSSRTIKFSKIDNESDSIQLFPKGKILFVHVGPGLASNTSMLFAIIFVTLNLSQFSSSLKLLHHSLFLQISLNDDRAMICGI